MDAYNDMGPMIPGAVYPNFQNQERDSIIKDSFLNTESWKDRVLEKFKGKYARDQDDRIVYDIREVVIDGVRRKINYGPVIIGKPFVCDRNGQPIPEAVEFITAWCEVVDTNVILSNLDEQQVSIYMNKYAESLLFGLGVNLEHWGVSMDTILTVEHIIISQVFFAVQRALKGQEQSNISKLFKTKESTVIQNTETFDKSRSGILNRG